ncbi:MAG: transcriptional regulator [Kiritimatiellia bacterium]
MNAKHNPYLALEKLFHEPSRLSIMSALCGAPHNSMAFNDLKSACSLTDGNLSRHIKTLEDAGAVRVRKTFIASKPRTTMMATDMGRRSFMQYLEALEAVLKRAVDAVSSENVEAAAVPLRSYEVKS